MPISSQPGIHSVSSSSLSLHLITCFKLLASFFAELVLILKPVKRNTLIELTYKIRLLKIIHNIIPYYTIPFSLVPRPLFSVFICGGHVFYLWWTCFSFSATTNKNGKKRSGVRLYSIMHLSLSRSTYPRSGTGGDLQGSFNKFPTPGDNFMLQTPYILYTDSKNNENSWTNAPTLGTKYDDKSLQIPTHCQTWGRWGLPMIGALGTCKEG